MAMMAKNLLWSCAQIVAPRPPITHKDLTMRWSERRTAVRCTFEMTSHTFNSEQRAPSSAVAHLVLVRS